MRKLMILAVLALAVPAMAGSVVVSGTDNGGLQGTISYVATGGLARAFALDVTVSGGAKITAVSTTGMQPYRIYMGSIVITSGVVTNWGGPVAPSTDPGTCGQLQSSCITIEMGSLYDPDNAGDPNKPAASGNLIKITVDSACTVTMAANATRGGVVMEDATAAAPLTLNPFNIGGAPPVNCWDVATQCGGQNIGDATCDGNINLADLTKLKLSFGKAKGAVGYNCCADFDHSNAVNLADLTKLKLNFGKTGLTPKTLVQSCPP